MEMFGRTFAEELAIEIAQETPAALFQLLVVALLFSINSKVALEAAKNAFDRGWTSPEKPPALSYDDAGSYDKRTAKKIGMLAGAVMDRYKGDLRILREMGGHNSFLERELLKKFKGVDDRGADIFVREIQAVWNENYPFLDRHALTAARRLGLGDDPDRLAALVEKQDFPKLASSLSRIGLSHAYEEVSRRAASLSGAADGTQKEKVLIHT